MTTIKRTSEQDAEFKRLCGPFMGLSDSQKASAFHEIVGWLAGHALRGQDDHRGSASFARDVLESVAEPLKAQQQETQQGVAA